MGRNVANQFYGNCIPFPFDVIAPLSVEFIDEHGRSTRITAARLTMTAVSDEKYLESFPGRRRLNVDRLAVTQDVSPKKRPLAVRQSPVAQRHRRSMWND